MIQLDAKGREGYADCNGGRIKPLLNYCGERVLPH